MQPAPSRAVLRLLALGRAFSGLVPDSVNPVGVVAATGRGLGDDAAWVSGRDASAASRTLFWASSAATERAAERRDRGGQPREPDLVGQPAVLCSARLSRSVGTSSNAAASMATNRAAYKAATLIPTVAAVTMLNTMTCSPAALVGLRPQSPAARSSNGHAGNGHRAKTDHR